MGNDIACILKKGAVIVHKNKKKEGIVIDWGVIVNMKRAFDGREKEILIPSTQLADSIRVQTQEGTIEIWPAEAVELLGF